jgi:phage-related protein
MVCHKDFETRHIADFIRVKEDKPAPPWTRPEPTDTFQNVCYLWAQSAYSDLAEADCATADADSFTYSFLRDLKES